MIDTFLRPDWTFETFAYGSCNQLAVSVALSAAIDHGAIFTPLIIYGGHGLGKSHLLHAVGHQALRWNPAMQIRYCSADTFVQEFIECLKENQMDSFRASFGSVDLLLLDDLQRLDNKERSQQELLYLFDKLFIRQSRIVLAVDRHTSKLDGFSDALHSRFSGGMQVELTMPDYEIKRLILEKLALRHQVKLVDEVADFLADVDVSGIRQLEGMLIRLGTYSSLMNVEMQS
ncbi:ATP-binding protein [Trichlorobacter lovleyi]|uniref:DnaA ATPase domain-containing protein n=1 Tax=Trichlorobacter lovleyi TaxID=313985 RepID=UPI00223ED26D|nr:DnaA/Hda family protein [Trichlorobacter lovleyi]QOX77395.1 ATP-binding protein [Trichlorobacter lovleyi]